MLKIDGEIFFVFFAPLRETDKQPICKPFVFVKREVYIYQNFIYAGKAYRIYADMLRVVFSLC